MGRLYVHLLFLLGILLQGIQGQVISPSSVDVAVRDEVLLECTTGAPNGFIFTWIHVESATTIYTAGIKSPPNGSYDNFYLDEDVAAKRSILNISNIQLPDKGSYRCTVTGQGSVDATVNVEVQSSRTLSVASPLEENIEYSATCEVLEGRPDETIAWMLGDGGPPCGEPVVTYLVNGPDLFSKRSVCTFLADREDNEKILRCVISGHQVPELNGEETAPLNITYAPDTGIMVVRFEPQGTDLRVLCDIADENQPNPIIMNYYIYSNGTLKHQSTTGENFVDAAESEFDLYTDFLCVAGNYLGNTTSPTARYARPTAPPPTTGSPPTNVGAIVGGVVGGIVLIIIIVLVIKFLVKPECMGGSGFSFQALFACCKCSLPSNSGGSRKKPASSAVGSSNGSEKDKIKPSAAPRTQSSIQHTTDNPEQAEYAMVDRKPGGGGKGGGDMPDKGYGAGQNEPAGMVYADLDLSAKAGHTEKQIPQNKDDVVVYSSILV